jgi:anti-anti-sigma factor
MSTLSIESDVSVPVVRLQGELDCASAQDLEAALSGQLQAHRAVVLDLTELSFLDCAGLGVVLAIDHRARRAGRRILLANPAPAVARLLTLTHCDVILETRSSLAEALDSAGRSQVVPLERERWPA